MNNKIKKIINEFKFKGEFLEIEENNQGNINKTYVLKYKDGDRINKYLIQKINNSVFREPYIVMENIDKVTHYINNKLKEMNDTKHKTLEIIKTKNNDNLFVYINEEGEKEYYRAYSYVENCYSYDNFKEEEDALLIAYNAGKAFGFFQRILNDFPISEISETIPNFHNTPKRFEDFIESIKKDVKKRALELPKEIVTLITKIKECSIIMDKLGKTIPIRVCHNDTKVNNVLIDKETKEAIAVIDLDTVMPGSGLFDVGDGIRSSAAKTLEDDTKLEEVGIDIDIAKEYLKGYLEEMSEYLTDDEVKYMALSIKIITTEQCLRFLTDYLNGDTYFKIKYNTHNKDRFLNQYYLLMDIEKKLNELDKYINKTNKEIKRKCKIK